MSRDMAPFLSIIIAAHNGEKTLSETLQSLLDASRTVANEVEIILVNDGSSDGTQEIIDNFAPPGISVLSLHVEFCNIGKTRQAAIEKASGKYITMLDSDDLLIKNSLDDIVPFLRKHSPDMFLTHLEEIRDPAKITHFWPGLSPVALSRDETIRRFLIHKDFQAHLIGQFILRSHYQAEPIAPMTCYEDFFVFPAIVMRSQNIWFQKQGHYYYIKRENSLSNDLDNVKIQNLIICTEKMQNIFPGKFHCLVLCHWLDILVKQKQWLTEAQTEAVSRQVQSLFSFSFFLSPNVRFSYKKKALKYLWKN
jgi:glycosyltransferase involved in cell wall biosynthesis